MLFLSENKKYNDMWGVHMESNELNKKDAIMYALFVIYIIVLFKITIFRYPNMIYNFLDGYSYGARNLNTNIFETIDRYFTFMSNGGFLIGLSNLLGNVILFIPLGFMVPVLFPKMDNIIKIVLLAIVLSCSIEVFQYIFSIGATDVDDVILNTIGAIVGYLIYIVCMKFLDTTYYKILISVLLILVTSIGLFVGTGNNSAKSYHVMELIEIN